MPYRKPDDQRIGKHKPVTLARISDGPPSKPPPPPKSLAAVGRALWREVWKSQAGSWLDPDQDQPVLTRYCALADDADELRRIIGDQGMMTAGSQGQLVAHPAVLMLRQVERSALQLEMALGLSPQGRARLGLNVTQLRREQLRREQSAAHGTEHRPERRMRAIDPSVGPL